MSSQEESSDYSIDSIISTVDSIMSAPDSYEIDDFDSEVHFSSNNEDENGDPIHPSPISNRRNIYASSSSASSSSSSSSSSYQETEDNPMATDNIASPPTLPSQIPTVANDEDIIFVESRSTVLTVQSDSDSDDSIQIILSSNQNNSQINDIEIIENNVSHQPLPTNHQTDRQPANEPTPDQNLNDSENNCIICTEMFTNSGPHHIVTLKCGHLFGKSCIENWLAPARRNQRCPQCNKPAKKRDILKIYSQNVRPLNTWDRNEMAAELKLIKEKNELLEKQISMEKVENKLLIEKNESLFHENQRLKIEIMELRSRNTVGGKRFKISPPESSSSLNSFNLNLAFMKDIEVNELSPRYFCYLDLLEAFAVNTCNKNASTRINDYFPAYGVSKIPIESVAKAESFFIHCDEIKAMVANQYDGSLVTVSKDKTLKISSIISKSIMTQVNLFKEPWSVAVPEKEKDFIWVGFKDGTINLYDRREPSKQIFTIFAPTPTPIVSLSTITHKNNRRKILGLLSVHLDSCWLYTFKESSYTSDFNCVKTPHEGKSYSSHYDHQSGHSLLSFRPGNKHSRSTHYMMSIDYFESAEALMTTNIATFEGGVEQIPLSRSKIFTSPKDRESTMVCASDSPSRAMIWSYNSDKTLSHQPINTLQPVFDFHLVPRTNLSLLACCGEKAIKIYNMY